MARSNIKAVFENDVQTVWNVITDVKNYIWRTDLSIKRSIKITLLIQRPGIIIIWTFLISWSFQP